MPYGVEIYDDNLIPRVSSSHNSFQLDFFSPSASGSKTYPKAANEEILVSILEYQAGDVGSPGMVGNVSINGGTVSWDYILPADHRFPFEYRSVLLISKRGIPNVRN